MLTEQISQRLYFLLEAAENAFLRKRKSRNFQSVGFLAGQRQRQHRHTQVIDIGVGVMDSQA